MEDNVLPYGLAPIEWVEDRQVIGSGAILGSICEFCDSWSAHLVTDGVGRTGPITGAGKALKEALLTLTREALAEHVVDCAPDLSSATDVARWLES